MLLMILTAALIGLFAVVYRHILAYEEILNWWFKFGDRYSNRWFYKPIWGCELCVSGQIAFWTYAFNWIVGSYFHGNSVVRSVVFKIIPTYHWQNNNALEGFIFVFTSIASAFIIYKGFNKIKD